MKFIKEVTVWANATPNHTYLVTDSKDKMLGYVRNGGRKLEMFSEPLPFYPKGRKFVEVANSWGYREPELVNTKDSWQVRSESGSVYTITRSGSRFSCSCQGFKFRSKCKHSENFVEPA